MIAEPGRVDRGRRDDAPQFRSLREQASEVAEQEVDVQRPLVGFVQDDRVVLIQKPVVGRLGQQDAVGHQLDVGFRPRAVGEADLEADVLPEGRPQFLGQPGGDGAGGEPSRLRVPDQAVHAAPHLQADLGQLGRFARPGLAAHDDHRVLRDGRGDLLTAGMDGQRFVVGDRGQIRLSGRPTGRGLREWPLQFVPVVGVLAGPAAPRPPGSASERAAGSDPAPWPPRWPTRSATKQARTWVFWPKVGSWFRCALHRIRRRAGVQMWSRSWPGFTFFSGYTVSGFSRRISSDVGAGFQVADWGVSRCRWTEVVRYCWWTRRFLFRGVLGR